MLAETLSQPLIFLMLGVYGFLSGVVFDASNFIWNLNNKNKKLRHFLDFFATIIVFNIFFMTIFKYNFGELRVYEFVVFFALFSLERFTLGKIVEKLFCWCYNIYINLTKKVNKIFKRKKNDKKSS